MKRFEEVKRFKKELDRLSIKSNLEYGELGYLYKVHYTPDFMQKWPTCLIGISCWILNHLPYKLSYRLEIFLNRYV